MFGKAYCPHCNASFNVGQEQLEAAQGLVRCGRCMEIFDVHTHFEEDPASQQLELPISNDLDFTVTQPDTAQDTPLDLDISDLREPLFADDEGHTPVELDVDGDGGVAEWPHDDQHDLYLDEAIEPLVVDEAPSIETLLPVEEDPSQRKADILELEAMQESGVSEAVEYEFSRKSYRVWPWATASGLLLLTLLLQAAYLFRVDLAARLPASKPLLVSACQPLNCSVPLPQNTNLMSIESSDLTDAKSHIVFNALLRNHASYTQAFPQLELTLTDTQDTPVSRRIFKPAEYLPITENEMSGLPANHEANIKLFLDTGDIKPSGYRLALLYPQ